MGRKILVPVDNSDSAWQAFEYALEHNDEEQITALYVVDPLEGDYLPDGPVGGPAKRSEQVQENARERVEQSDVPDSAFEFVTVEGRPPEEIVEYARQHDIDQIVMGSRGRSGMKRLLLGSVAETVVRRSPVPVNIVR